MERFVLPQAVPSATRVGTPEGGRLPERQHGSLGAASQPAEGPAKATWVQFKTRTDTFPSLLFSGLSHFQRTLSEIEPIKHNQH